MVVLEAYVCLVCAGLRHLDGYCSLVDASIVGLMLLHQVLSGEAVEAALAKTLVFLVGTLVLKKLIKVFDPSIVVFLPFSHKEEIDGL